MPAKQTLDFGLWTLDCPFHRQHLLDNLMPHTCHLRIAGVHFVIRSERPLAHDPAVGADARYQGAVLLTRDGKYDEAIAKFTEASGMVPGCYDCFYNIGFNHSQKKEYDQAEAAFLKSIEMKATYVDAYNGLATVYNAQKKFDKAQEASAKASELAGAAGPGGGDAAIDCTTGHVHIIQQRIVRPRDMVDYIDEREHYGDENALQDADGKHT